MRKFSVIAIITFAEGRVYESARVIAVILRVSIITINSLRMVNYSSGVPFVFLRNRIVIMRFVVMIADIGWGLIDE